MQKYRIRRVIGLLIVALTGWLVANYDTDSPTQPANTSTTQQPPAQQPSTTPSDSQLAHEVLNQLVVKGRAPKTDYSRDQFGPGWGSSLGCDTRNTILYRDLTGVKTDDKCRVINGTLNDPYTGKIIQFQRGEKTSPLVQIDHVVALSDAWQKGAQQLTYEQRVAFSNDPLNLLAVDGEANQKKSDSDAASWLPSQRAFRCQYVARQIAVKQKYALWVTAAEKNAIAQVLSACPEQQLP